MKKLFLLCVTLLVIAAAVILLRAVLFSSDPGTPVAVKTVEVDAARVSRHISQAITFRTVSTGDPQSQDYAPFEAFVDWLKSAYPQVHREIPLSMVAKHTLLYKWQGSNPALKPILLTGHYDVVPIVPGTEGDWQYPPFSGTVTDEHVWGRGAMDDKSGVIVMLEAATLLLKENFTPERTVYFSFGHDEETGGNLGARGVTEKLQTEGVQLAWSIDEGSFIMQDMMPGMSQPMANINVAEKGSMTLDLVAHAAGGHSSIPANEVATDILAKALVRLRENPVPGGLDGLSGETVEGFARNGPFAFRLLAANQWLFGALLEKQLSANSFTNALIRTTTAPTMLSAGIKSNVIPPTATATVNFRLHPRDTPESVKAHVIAAIDDQRVSVSMHRGGLSALASTVSSRDSEAYHLIARVARQVFGDIAVVPGITVGGTDSKHYSKVADNAYRFQYMLTGPDDIAGFHGTNERVSIDNLIKGTSAYYLLIKQGAADSKAPAL